jgi:hypothetical protein
MLKFFLEKDRFPLIILLVCIIAYGVFIPFLGFYWDDLPYMWFKHTTGVSGVFNALALDRPLLGLFYLLPMSILGQSSWVWQIFAIFCRFLFILSVYKFINKIFPEQLRENKYLILLFSVFPGFSQQWISVIYSHAFLIFALYFFSLSIFVDLINEKIFNWPKLIAVLSLSFISLVSSEYMAGMEILRPFIIFMILAKNYPNLSLKQKVSKTIAKWAPFLIAVFVFIYYRIFIASSVLYKVGNFDNPTTSPLIQILHLLQVQFENIFTATIIAWVQIFRPFKSLQISSIFSKLYVVFLTLTFAITVLIIMKIKPSLPQNSDKKRQWISELLLGSLLTLFFVGIPFGVANLKPQIHFPNDRIFIPFMLGSSAIIYLIIRLIGKTRLKFALLFGLIFSLSISYQVFLGNTYRTEWENFEQFFKQISWRIPSLAENTILVTDQLPLQFYSDNSLTAAFNWVYLKSPDGFNLPYMINYTQSRLGKSLPSLAPGTKITHNYRTFHFSGTTDQLILLYHTPPGCVHLADPEIDLFNPLLSKEIRPAAALSRLDLIGKNKKQNSVFFLKSEPEQSWCYYYQKASLAVQNENFEEAAELGDIAFGLNDYPNDASERMPFIEAYAAIGRIDKALALSTQTIQISNLYNPMVCRLWERINQRSLIIQSGPDAKVQEFIQTNCP